jgi:amidase
MRALLAVAGLLAACRPESALVDASLMDFDAPALAAMLAAGEVSAEQAVRAALARIAELDDAGPELHAIIEINPDAIALARALDERFAATGPVGPLHGVPVVLKANIDTGDRMATTAGAVALRDHHALRDAELVTHLREAGAVIVAKANLSELANFRSTTSSSGWSSLGGQTKNPYALTRNPCGSSSGSAVAVAARMVPLAVGTETDGSIVCPAAVNGIVGIKPTLGRVSQDGIIPIAASQDTAGPMARTVRGAALLLAAMSAGGDDGDDGDDDGGDRGDRSDRSEGSEGGEGDEGSEGSEGAASGRVSPRTLDGVRIGVWRAYAGAGTHPGVEAAFAGWIAQLRGAGAVLVDPMPLELPENLGQNEYEVLLYEFNDGIARYLEGAQDAPRSLEAIIAYNAANADVAMPYFGQDILELALARHDLASPAYRDALASSRDAVRTALSSAFAALELDAIVAPANAPAWPIDLNEGDVFSLSSSTLAAVSGFPSVVVPGGLVDGLPVGIAFVGQWNGDETLIDIAAGFEALLPPMPPPRFEDGP